MKINESNKQRIHDVLISDLQRRIFKQYNERTSEFLRTDEDYDVTQELLVNRILHVDTLADVNELVISNSNELEISNFDTWYENANFPSIDINNTSKDYTEIKLYYTTLIQYLDEMKFNPLNDFIKKLYY